MKTRSIFTWGVVSLLGVLCVSQVLAQKVKPTEKVKPITIFMRQKLDYSQSILEGIVLERPDLIVTNGTKLWRMSQANTWRALNNPLYTEKSTKFQDDVLVLIDSARANSNPEILEAYSRVTADCIDCHQNCRRTQFVQHNKGVAPKNDDVNKPAGIRSPGITTP
jgi:hypothetical protein